MVGIGVVGVGGIGRAHAKNLKALPDVTMVCCYDVAHDSALKAGQELGLKVFDSLRGMILSSEVDAVFICTPPFAHREAVEVAAAAGKHVFCEKPMAATYADAKSMEDVLKASGVRFAMGFVLRYWPIYSYIRSLVDGGQLGALHHLWLTDVAGAFPLGAGSWRRLRRNNAGIAEQVIHEIDVLRFIAGDVQSVCARGGRYGAMDADYEDNLVYSLALSNGGMGTIIGSLSSRQPDRSGGLIAEKGAILFDTRTQSAKGRVDAIGTVDRLFPWNDALLDEVRDFIYWIEGGAQPRALLSDGVKAMEIAEAAYISLAKAAEVHLPLEL